MDWDGRVPPSRMQQQQQPPSQPPPPSRGGKQASLPPPSYDTTCKRPMVRQMPQAGSPMMPPVTPPPPFPPPPLLGGFRQFRVPSNELPPPYQQQQDAEPVRGRRESPPSQSSPSPTPSTSPSPSSSNPPSGRDSDIPNQIQVSATLIRGRKVDPFALKLDRQAMPPIVTWVGASVLSSLEPVKKGDTIMEIEGVRPRSQRDAMTRIKQAAGTSLRLLVRREKTQLVLRPPPKSPLGGGTTPPPPTIAHPSSSAASSSSPSFIKVERIAGTKSAREPSPIEARHHTTTTAASGSHKKDEGMGGQQGSHIRRPPQESSSDSDSGGDQEKEDRVPLLEGSRPILAYRQQQQQHRDDDGVAPTRKGIAFGAEFLRRQHERKAAQGVVTVDLLAQQQPPPPPPLATPSTPKALLKQPQPLSPYLVEDASRIADEEVPINMVEGGDENHNDKSNDERQAFEEMDEPVEGGDDVDQTIHTEEPVQSELEEVEVPPSTAPPTDHPTPTVMKRGILDTPPRAAAPPPTTTLRPVTPTTGQPYLFPPPPPPPAFEPKGSSATETTNTTPTTPLPVVNELEVPPLRAGAVFTAVVGALCSEKGSAPPLHRTVKASQSRYRQLMEEHGEVNVAQPHPSPTMDKFNRRVYTNLPPALRPPSPPSASTYYQQRVASGTSHATSIYHFQLSCLSSDLYKATASTTWREQHFKGVGDAAGLEGRLPGSDIANQLKETDELIETVVLGLQQQAPLPPPPPPPCPILSSSHPANRQPHLQQQQQQPLEAHNVYPNQKGGFDRKLTKKEAKRARREARNFFGGDGSGPQQQQQQRQYRAPEDLNYFTDMFSNFFNGNRQ